MALKGGWKSCIPTGYIWTFKHRRQTYMKILYAIKYSFVSFIAWPSTLLFESGQENRIENEQRIQT